MRARRQAVLGLLALLAPTAAGAQGVASLTSCPVSGAAAPADTADTAAIDTVYTLAVEERRWSLSDVSESVAAGVAGTENAPWHACAGAWVTLRRVEMIVEGARGTVRLRADLGPLRERLRVRRQPREQNPGREEL